MIIFKILVMLMTITGGCAYIAFFTGVVVGAIEESASASEVLWALLVGLIVCPMTLIKEIFKFLEDEGI